MDGQTPDQTTYYTQYGPSDYRFVLHAPSNLADIHELATNGSKVRTADFDPDRAEGLLWFRNA